jgi:hypothetical protein
MIWLVQDSVDEGSEGIGLRLQGALAAALDLVGPADDVTEELADQARQLATATRYPRSSSKDDSVSWMVPPATP